MIILMIDFVDLIEHEQVDQDDNDIYHELMFESVINCKSSYFSRFLFLKQHSIVEIV